MAVSVGGSFVTGFGWDAGMARIPLFPYNLRSSLSCGFSIGLSNNVARPLTWDSGVLKAQKLKLSALRTGTESFPS